MLAYQLDRLAQKNRWSRDFTFNSLRHALREIIACFPVYRSYISEDGVRDRDRRYVIAAVNRAKRRNPAITAALFHFVRDMLLLRYPETATEADRAEQRRFVGKFQQVTAPVMAKGIEDTAFYVYNRLLSLNEVGGDPGRFGVPPDELHRFLQDRQAAWPWALSPLSTHDTKRSEDVRARLNVLSEMPDEWRAPRPLEPAQRGPAHRRRGRAGPGRQRGIPALSDPDRGVAAGACTRRRISRRLSPAIQAYMLKAIHEAKVHTSWINPNRATTTASRSLSAASWTRSEARHFLRTFERFRSGSAITACSIRLSQTLLQDRGPRRARHLPGHGALGLQPGGSRQPPSRGLPPPAGDVGGAEGEDGTGRRRPARPGRELVAAKEDGRIKLYVTHLGLQCRRENPGLFTDGAYVPLQAEGPRKDHVFGFARGKDGRWAVAVAPRFVTRLAPTAEHLPTGRVWEETVLPLPGTEAVRRWRNIYTGEVHTPSGARRRRCRCGRCWRISRWRCSLGRISTRNGANEVPAPHPVPLESSCRFAAPRDHENGASGGYVSRKPLVQVEVGF